ncbi:MAG: calcium-binding protein [Thermodesulfobacteriota bacterium]
MRRVFIAFSYVLLLASASALYSADAFAQLRCNGFFVTIVGSPFGDVIFGTPGPDVIHGLGGNDEIYGLGSNDVICGGAGHDTIRGGAGHDQVFGQGGNDTLFGQAGHDFILGGLGNDTLRGNNGNDTLNGAGGTDDCDGGAGVNNINNCENGFVCQSPPLTTNFSNIGVFFVDPFNAILVGLTSNGFDVSLVLTDIPFNGAILGLGAFATSSTHCIVDFGVFDTDFDGSLLDELIFNASGICDLVVNRTVIFVDNVVVAGEPLGFNITGECSDIVFLSTTAVKGEAPSTDDMTSALIDAAAVVAEDLTDELRSESDDSGSGSIMDFQQDLEE